MNPESSFSPENPVLLTAENLTRHFPVGGKSGRNARLLRALDGVSFQIRQGEIFGVVGESGCGKSTLGRCVLRLYPLTAGRVVFGDRDISRLGRKELKPLRRDMQMIFQNPYSSFNPKQTIGSALTEVARSAGFSPETAREQISIFLGYISLPEEVLRRHPGELSGGQLQRLAIARALLSGPRFIVADEAVSALDVSVQAQILNLLVDLREKLGLTLLFISHDMTVVEHLCDTVAVMYLGRIVELAPAAAIFSHVYHPYTQALLSAVPRTDPEETSHRILLKGDVPNAMEAPQGCAFSSRCPKCCDRCRTEAPALTLREDAHYVACHLA